jgi:hypothetical protein
VFSSSSSCPSPSPSAYWCPALVLLTPQRS